MEDLEKKLEKIENELDEIIQEKDTTERILYPKNTVNTLTDPMEKYKIGRKNIEPDVKNFRNFIKGIVFNKPNLLPEETKNFLNESTGTEGGFLVPEEFGNKIYENITRGGIARRNCTVVKMSRRELKLPKLQTLPTFTFVSEGGLKPISNPAFSQVILQRKDGGFIVIFSKQLIDDEDFDLMNFISNIASKIIMLNEDNSAFRGLGGINGLLTNGTGATQIVTSGNNFSTITYENLIDATVAVPSHTLENSKWYMNRTVWGLIKKMKYSGTGEYVVSPEDRKNMTLEGFPVELTDGCYSMGESATNRAFVGFGDLKYLVMGERKGLTIDFSKEATVDIGSGNFLNLWQQGLVGLNFGVSYDMKFTFPEALSVIKTT